MNHTACCAESITRVIIVELETNSSFSNCIKMQNTLSPRRHTCTYPYLTVRPALSFISPPPSKATDTIAHWPHLLSPLLKQFTYHPNLTRQHQIRTMRHIQQHSQLASALPLHLLKSNTATCHRAFCSPAAPCISSPPPHLPSQI